MRTHPSPSTRRIAAHGAALLLFLATPALATPPLLNVEARLTEGLSIGGSSHAAAYKLAAPTLGIVGDYAIAEQPRVSLYAEAIFEALKRAGVGLGAGVRLRPFDSGLRVGIGAIGMLTPYTHAGVAAMAGECFKVGVVRACLDAEVAVFMLGDDLPKNGVDGQLRLALSAGFDAL